MILGQPMGLRSIEKEFDMCASCLAMNMCKRAEFSMQIVLKLCLYTLSFMEVNACLNQQALN